MDYQKKSELLQQFVDAWLGGTCDNTLHSLYHKELKPQLNELANISKMTDNQMIEMMTI